MAKGRPRKSGKRTKSGRLISPIVKGSDRAEERKALFGQDAMDAIGRAYRAGLLGEGDQAKDRLSIGRRYAQAYHAEYSITRYRCALDTSPRGFSGDIDGQTNDRREWVDDQSRKMVATGCAPFADQLLDPLRVWTDNSPAWLERLIDNALANRQRELRGQARLAADERDWVILKAALVGIDAMLLPSAATSGRAVVQRMAA